MTTYNEADGITREALETRLREVRRSAAALYSFVALAIDTSTVVHSGAEFVAMTRDINVLGLLVDTAMSQAEELVGRVAAEVMRIESEEL